MPVEPRRLQREERDIGRVQQALVSVVRADRLERFVRGVEAVEQGSIVDDLNWGAGALRSQDAIERRQDLGPS